MIRISDILDKVQEHHPDADTGLIDRAYIFSARVHEGQVRLSGEPYLSHPLEVADILAAMKLDVVSVAAGLLHDVVEDTHATPEQILDLFGPDVLHIVSGVTKLSKVDSNSSQAREAESIRKMLLAMADDLRVVLIKLADRVHNMRTLQYHRNEQKQRKIAQETIDIYAPIAARLGIYWMKNELENTSFRYILPEKFDEISRRVAKDKIEREVYIASVKSILKKQMEEHHMDCEVLGRYKNFYSIYQKMVQQNLAFEDIYDIIAFRIIIDTIPKCYEALGIIHSLWKPIAHKFKDYIGVPKPNMYQSLHTTVVGPYGDRIEIQIRTREMDRVAKSGIAAHWSYKEGKGQDETATKKFAWIQNIVENQEEFKDPKEFLENVRIDLFPDEVYVYTPKGEIKSLVKGSTPVDFAYLIHTEVGNQCVGAKVDGRMVPLKYELKTGNRVEIVTLKNSQPSKDWLNFVKTVKARSRVRQWIKTQEKNRSISLGREMCEKAFRKQKLNFNVLIKNDVFQKVVESFSFKASEDLIANVGYGKITPLQVIKRLSAFGDKDCIDAFQQPASLKSTEKTNRKSDEGGVVVKGIDDILLRFGKCCQPVPGDSITGYITRGHGVTVHRTSCINALKMNPDRQIEVDWSDHSSESYPVRILIRSYDRVGLLADLTSIISKKGANIISAKTKTWENRIVDAHFTIEVENTEQLESVLAALKKINQVWEVRRIES